MELTVDQARAYLASVGVSLPDIILELLVEQANSIDACLTGAGYPAATQTLIKLYLIRLLGTVSGDRLVTSESAPSGASRSYRYGTLTDQYNSALKLLQMLDTSNCTGALIPASPSAANAGLWVSTPTTCRGGWPN